MWFVLRVLLRLLRLTGRSRQDLILENLAVRHQIAVLERTARRPALRDRDRRLGSLLAQEWMGWRPHLHSVQPATVVGWHRTAWRRYGRWKSRGRRPGRPRLDPEIQAIIQQIARENPRWGSPRIVGERPRPHRPRFDGAALPAAARIGAVPHLALVPPAPCPRDLGRRLLHGPDADLADAGCLPLHQPCPAPHHALGRDGPADRTVGLAAGDPSDAGDHRPAVPHPRSRPQRRWGLRTAGRQERRAAELPVPDRLVRDCVASLEQELDDVAEAERVPETPQHGEQDDIRRVLKIVERRAGPFVEATSAYPAVEPRGSRVRCGVAAWSSRSSSSGDRASASPRRVMGEAPRRALRSDRIITG